MDPPYPDLFDSGKMPFTLDDNLKKEILTSKWDRAHLFSFPSRYGEFY